jgi:hypothetical protein
MRYRRAPEHQRVPLLIQAPDGSGEGVWATPTIAAGIFELDNFPISRGENSELRNPNESGSCAADH